MSTIYAMPATAVAGLLLCGCTVNNPPARTDPVVVREVPPPAATTIQPGTTAIVPPGSVIVPPRY